MIVTNRLSIKKLAVAVALTATAISTSNVMAAEQIEEITVTGSYIARPADRPQPVAVMDNAELIANQRVTIAEAVRNMPQVSSANTTGNWNTPTNSINLRGLGARSTLILLNGQRQTIDANSASQVDINNLAPAIALERIELVLDGASALYGSDAVAGVANFITRDNFEGAEISASAQVSDHQTNIPEVLVGGIFGVQGDDMGLMMSLEYLKRADEMQSQDRYDFDRLGRGLITGLYNPGTFGGGNLRPGFFADPLCGSELVGGFGGNIIWNPAGATGQSATGTPLPGNAFCRGTLSWQRSIIPENEQLTGMAVATKQFDSDFLQSAKIEMNFARVKTRSSFGTGVPLLALSSYGAVLPATNPGVIDANKRNPAFPLQDYRSIFTRQASPLEGHLSSRAQQHTFRTAITLDGMLTDGWDWRVTGTTSWNQQESGSPDTIADRYVQAIAGYGGGNCNFNPVSGAANDPKIKPGKGGCEWWNPFASRLIAKPGDATYNSPELADWMTDIGVQLGNSVFYSMEAVITGQLWEMAGGETGFAVGAQARKQTLDIKVDSVSKDGGFGFAPQVIRDWYSARVTNSLFSELVMFPTDTLEFDLAARYEETEGESSVEPKISALWTPTQGLFIRASAGSSFRLASENQTYGIGASGTTIRTVGGEITQARALAVGNTNLKPETSDNWTVGATWDVTDNLTVEANWWNYQFTDLVTTVSPDDILLADMADGTISDPRIGVFAGRPREVCEVTGRWKPASGIGNRPADCITGLDFSLFSSSYINQDSVETDGIDWNINYTHEMFGGEAGIRFGGQWVNKYAGTDTSGRIVDVVGTDGSQVAGVGTNPRVRGDLMVSFNRENHTIRWTSRFTDGTKQRNPTPDDFDYSAASYTQHDVVYTYNLPSATAASLNLAILNIGDREPPLFANTLTTVNDALFDPRGRMYRLSLNYDF